MGFSLLWWTHPETGEFALVTVDQRDKKIEVKIEADRPMRIRWADIAAHVGWLAAPF